MLAFLFEFEFTGFEFAIKFAPIPEIRVFADIAFVFLELMPEEFDQIALYFLHTEHTEILFVRHYITLRRMIPASCRISLAFASTE